MMIKFYRHLLIYKYNFTFLLFDITYKLTRDKKTILILREISTFGAFLYFHFNSPQPQSLKTGSSWLIKDYTDEDFCKVI